MAKDLFTYSPADLADPAIDAATLAQLAQFRHDLWPQIIGHPNCYPALQQWIAEQMARTGAPVGAPSATAAAGFGPVDPGLVGPASVGPAPVGTVSKPSRLVTALRSIRPENWLWSAVGGVAGYWILFGIMTAAAFAGAAILGSGLAQATGGTTSPTGDLSGQYSDATQGAAPSLPWFTILVALTNQAFFGRFTVHFDALVSDEASLTGVLHASSPNVTGFVTCCVLLFLAGRLLERTRPSADMLQRVLQSAATALALTLFVLFMPVVTRYELPISDAYYISAHSISLVAVVFSLLAGFLATLAGRLSRAGAPLPRHRLTAVAVDAARAVQVYVKQILLGGGVATLVVFIVVAVKANLRIALGLFIIRPLDFVMDAFTFLLFGGMHTSLHFTGGLFSGSDLSDIDSSLRDALGNFTAFNIPGDSSTWWVPVVLALLLVLTCAIAAMHRYAHIISPGADPAGAASWLVLPLIYMALTALGLYVLRIGITGSGSVSGDVSFGSGMRVSAAAAVGPTWWILLTAPAIGLGVEALARFVAPRYIGLFPPAVLRILAAVPDTRPAVALFGGSAALDASASLGAPAPLGASGPYGAPAQFYASSPYGTSSPYATQAPGQPTGRTTSLPQPTPWTPERKRRARKTGIITLVVVLVLAAAGAGASVAVKARGESRAATSTAQAYLTALRGNDGDKLSQLEGSSGTDAERSGLNAGVYSGAGDKITGFTVVGTHRGSGGYTVDATVTQGGRTHDVTLTTQKKGNDWKVTSGLARRAVIAVPAGVKSLDVNDHAVSFSPQVLDDATSDYVRKTAKADPGDWHQVTLELYPGTYEIAVPQENSYFDIGAKGVQVPGDGGSTVVRTYLKKQLSSYFRQQAEAAIEESLSDYSCTGPNPSDCPFSLDGVKDYAGNDADVEWQVDTFPQYEDPVLRPDGTAYMGTKTSLQGTVSYADTSESFENKERKFESAFEANFTIPASGTDDGWGDGLTVTYKKAHTTFP